VLVPLRLRARLQRPSKGPLSFSSPPLGTPEHPLSSGRACRRIWAPSALQWQCQRPVSGSTWCFLLPGRKVLSCPCNLLPCPLLLQVVHAC